MCEVSAETIRKAHAICPLTAIQSEYHLMHRLVEENGVLDVCRELGIGFVPYSPINRGFLGGCINEYTVFDVNNDNRQTLPRFQPEAMRANTHIVNALQAFGRTRGMTSAQVAPGCFRKHRGSYRFRERQNCLIWRKTCAHSTSTSAPGSGKNWRIP